MKKTTNTRTNRQADDLQNAKLNRIILAIAAVLISGIVTASVLIPSIRF